MIIYWITMEINFDAYSMLLLQVWKEAMGYFKFIPDAILNFFLKNNFYILCNGINKITFNFIEDALLFNDAVIQ